MNLKFISETFFVDGRMFSSLLLAFKVDWSVLGFLLTMLEICSKMLSSSALSDSSKRLLTLPLFSFASLSEAKDDDDDAISGDIFIND